jgi:hypothetical protein
MTEIVLIFLALAGVAIGLALLARWTFTTFLRFRGQRVVNCPETCQPVGVEVDALHAAVTAPLGGGPELRLKDCTRWPEREACGQECLAQIEEAGDQCLVRTQLEEWYSGKSCVVCSKPIGPVRWLDHKPALLSPDGRPRALSEVRPEELSSVLGTHRQICWNCWVIASFRTEHPDLIVEDPRPSRAHPPVS